ncbi:MAG: ShlB/FhaC/HecB family hemolysin secretion/activation protein [Limnobacter sp.]|nr:ShlB/FhaC/HecB family hemolysin secretion/activation protein [Limnobacter sp.]
MTIPKFARKGLAGLSVLLAFPALSVGQDSAPSTPVPPAAGPTNTQQPLHPEPAKSRAYVEPAFTLSGFTVEGPELIPRERVNEVLSGFVDRPITFSELRTATVAVERLHAIAGYEVVRVIVPEQELKNGGTLTLQILDARLDVVSTQGNEFFPSEQIQKELYVLEPGILLNTQDMDTNLRLVNDNPSRTVRVALEPSDKPGLVDAKINVNDSKPLVAFATLDNTGTNATGDFRLGLVCSTITCLVVRTAPHYRF